jgi:hypothetical protein
MLIVVAGLLAGGCYEEIEPEPAADSAPAPAPGDDLANQGAGSALGKAKESAENTVSEVERRNQELMKQMEDPE